MFSEKSFRGTSELLGVSPEVPWNLLETSRLHREGVAFSEFLGETPT